MKIEESSKINIWAIHFQVSAIDRWTPNHSTIFLPMQECSCIETTKRNRASPNYSGMIIFENQIVILMVTFRATNIRIHSYYYLLTPKGKKDIKRSQIQINHICSGEGERIVLNDSTTHINKRVSHFQFLLSFLLCQLYTSNANFEWAILPKNTKVWGLVCSKDFIGLNSSNSR